MIISLAEHGHVPQDQCPEGGSYFRTRAELCSLVFRTHFASSPWNVERWLNITETIPYTDMVVTGDGSEAPAGCAEQHGQTVAGLVAQQES